LRFTPGHFREISPSGDRGAFTPPRCASSSSGRRTAACGRSPVP
jgi:hypothetical protein